MRFVRRWSRLVRRGVGSVRQASAGILSCCSTAYRGGVSDELDDVEIALRTLARDKTYALL
jgi:hypothetical protein